MLPQFQIPSPIQLLETFSFIKESVYDGVSGVCHFDSGQPGPTLGITIHTHGNEPSGLAALWYFLDKFPLKNNLKRGTVLFVLNNIKATENYLKTFELPENNEVEKEKKGKVKTKTRFVDHNMNRLPENVMNLSNPSQYEFRRAQELRKIWKLFDVGFDIHSGAQKIEPVIIACGGLLSQLFVGFPIRKLITNIENVQLDKPAVNFYGTAGTTKTLAVETGSHEESSSFYCSIDCCIALLRNLLMISGKSSERVHVYEHFHVTSSVHFPNSSYELERVLDWYAPIRKGQLLAHGVGQDEKREEIVALFDGHVLMGPKDIRPDSLTEEVLFLSTPMTLLRL